MKLHNFHRSSASFRVRIALNLKGIAYEYIPVNLMRGESHAPTYEKLNPQGIVPTLEDNGTIVQQSLAIKVALLGQFDKRRRPIVVFRTSIPVGGMAPQRSRFHLKELPNVR